MRLRPEQLAANLKRGNIAPIYFVSGDEPLQKLECTDMIRNVARSKGYNERIVFNIDNTFDWYLINNELSNFSLFSNKKIIELRMDSPKPGKQGSQFLCDYAAQTNPDHLLIISANKMDKGTQTNKWVKVVEKAGILITVWPISPAQLPAWIMTQFQAKQKQISQDAARLIALRVEGNLLAARQEIEKLSLLIEKNTIEVQDVIVTVADSARYDVFNMIESAFLGKANRALIMLSGLRNEGIEPLALFGALMWEFRRICTMTDQLEAGSTLNNIFREYRIWEQKKAPLTAVLNRHSAKTLHALLRYCSVIDKTIKSSQKEQAWGQFNLLFLALAGIKTDKLQRASMTI